MKPSSSEKSGLSQPTFEERVQKYRENLDSRGLNIILELAATAPGSAYDHPYAPIDPALHAAARQIVDELGLGKEVNNYKLR